MKIKEGVEMRVSGNESEIRVCGNESEIRVCANWSESENEWKWE